MDYYRELPRCCRSKSPSLPSAPLETEDLYISVLLSSLVTDASILKPRLTLE